MVSYTDAPDEAHWKRLDEDRRVPPYGMHRMVNRNTVEVIASAPNGDNSPKRWVLVRDGTHEVWVQVAKQDEYGYPLQPEERVSEPEIEAITLKHAALQDGSKVAVTEARALVEDGKSEQICHALIALYYAAKADPDIPTKDVDKLREVVREQTGHIDTSHRPTLLRALKDVDSLAE